MINTHTTTTEETQDMKTGKTPYEIRLDLLILAHQILTQKAVAEAGEEALSAIPQRDTPIVSSYPTTDDIIAEAKRLNNFVSGTQV